MTAFDPSQFTAPTAKPLPVILLLDVSGSMSGAKIQNLNEAVKEMLETFCDSESGEIEIHVAIITFGAEVSLHQELTSASNISWHDLSAGGATPMGTALKMAKAMIADKNIIPSRAYRPTVVLVSDGQPTDSWKTPLQDFINEGRSSKCDRMAMAIGADADEDVLGKFIGNADTPLLYAENAKQLRDGFKFITMTTMARTHSQDPNQIPKFTDIEVKPATIEERTERPKTAPAPSKDTDATNEQTDEEDYW